MPPVIHEQAEAWLVNDTDDLPAVPVDLLYDGDQDPRTVHVSFPGGDDWSFGRDLLEGGLRAPPNAAASGSGPADGRSWSWRSTRRTASRWCSSTARR